MKDKQDKTLGATANIATKFPGFQQPLHCLLAAGTLQAAEPPCPMIPIMDILIAYVHAFV